MTGSATTSPAAGRSTRRLAELILVAAHRACDEAVLDLAGMLLAVCEQAIAKEADPRRRRQDILGLIAAHERLWQLRHPAGDGSEAATSGPLPVSFGTALSGS